MRCGMNSIDVVMEALKGCSEKTSGFHCLKYCPYSQGTKDCLESLHADAIYYMKLSQSSEKNDISEEQPMLPGMEFLKREFKPDGKLDYVRPMTTDEYFDYLREKDELTPSEQAVFETMWSSRIFRMNHKMEE